VKHAPKKVEETEKVAAGVNEEAGTAAKPTSESDE